MKSNDFNLNEAARSPHGLEQLPWGNILGKPIRAGLEKVFNPAGYTSQQKNFINLFTQQFNRERQSYPNLNVDDFLEMYWRKNQWDVSKLPPTYKQALDNAKQTVATNPNEQSIEKLANVVYNIALMMPEYTNTQQNQSATPATMPSYRQPAPAKIDTDTNQIISKIRSMKSTPEEIDDLLNIAAVTMIKLYKIAPKDYKRIIASLFNNGGKPSVSAATSVAQQSTPPETAPITEPITFGTSKAQKSTKLDPNDPNDASLIAAIQRSQAGTPRQ